jgi:hypothetical protein
MDWIFRAKKYKSLQIYKFLKSEENLDRFQERRMIFILLCLIDVIH